ncbi:MAG: hypothetical protein AAGC74_12135 [Verrucomicrobiota bacterium]
MLAELQYDLTRMQRLIPHIRAWGVVQLFVIAGLVGAVAAAIDGSWISAVVMGLLVLWFGRGYIIGLLNVIFVQSQHMDIRIEDKGLGYMSGKERCYILHDGLTAVREFERSVWTIQHWNGTVINIPKKELSADTLAFLQDWVRRANDYRDQHGIRSPHLTKITKENSRSSATPVRD